MYDKLKLLMKCVGLSIISISCNSPQFKPVQRCVIDLGNQSCWCQAYDLNQMKKIDNAVQYPIEHCEKNVGFSAEEWAQEIRPTAIEIRSYWQDQCGGSNANAQ